MKIKTTIVLAVLLCGLLLVGGGVWAMSSGNYAIDWNIIGGGGGPASSASYGLRGTIGQPAAESSFSTNYGLWSGYWYPAAVEPSITVTSPNGGENWNIGSTRTITWTSSGVAGNVHIDISYDGGSSWSTVVANTPNDGSYVWIVSGPATAQAKIRVTSASSGSIWDMSDGSFTIGVWDDWDVNCDFSVNVLDMVSVGQHWAATGAAHWIREDANRDGAINVLDMVLIGQHWTG